MTGSSREVVSALMLPQSATLKSNTEVFQGGGRGEGGSSVLMHLVCLVLFVKMVACSSRLHVAERRTRVAKGTPAAAAAAEEVADHDDDLPDPLDDLPERGEVCFGW